ncbi:sulfotransferase [Nitrosococcus wardiae]|uniref:Sulfotransferase domain-containing protein n=1 Tax=Nitrosococcus wardiae TaxID=1814290 RepID=A0A4P7C4T3_9GAMM|nr:sulfotransferase [Nitrosococcus wardiae]QBQ55966.1 hypothetical protein E3U44_16690 [Nitrosococcus wardiae]
MQEVLQGPRILYIASSSRSGSTILEHTLGAVEGVFNVGELRRISDFYNMNSQAIRDPANSLACTCGAKVVDCTFWREVEKESGLALGEAKFSSQLDSINRSLFKIIFFISGPKITKWFSKIYKPFEKEIAVGENCFKVYSAIKKITKAKYVVDSSKMIHHFLVLKTVCPERVSLLALFRDGRAVSKSMIRGERKRYFKKGNFSNKEDSSIDYTQILRAAILSWVITTLQILLFYIRLSKKYRHFIRYEDFCNEPNSVLVEVLFKFGLTNIESTTRNPEKYIHTIGGSPSRFSSTFRKIDTDKRWRKDWNKKDARIFTIYAGLINRMLGYK